MKSTHYLKLLSSLFILFSCLNSAHTQFNEEYPQSWNYAIEINDVLCGYTESALSLQIKDGLPVLLMQDKILIKLSVLGGGVDMTIDNNFLLDPDSKKPRSIEHLIKTTAEVYGYSKFENGKVFHTSLKDGDLIEIDIPEGTIIENSLNYPHLMKDFIYGDLNEKSYEVYDDMRGNIATKKYKRVGDEEIQLAGKLFNTIILDEINQRLGTSSRIWLDKETSFPVKLFVSGRNIYLADESVKKKISVVDMDNVLFAKVDKMISNVPAINYMKVYGLIESAGEWIDEEQLNFRGQKFTGTVTDNLVDGVFELTVEKYNGDNAPDFPVDITDKDLQKYIDPESLIESDDPVLIAEARNITKGATDAWEASVLLSKWVAENIRGAVPGGTSAINTYNTREGECGSHSRLLAAFCRAVGIPSRLSVGCMYSPYLGGSFGQHAWTEVYMGDAGWVAIDATAFEFDYVDAGHIRLGEGASFNPKEMKILEYRLEGQGTQKVTVNKEYEKYLGTYSLEGANRNFEVKFLDGNLAVDIPGQTVLALNEPDENGIFYPIMTRQVNFSFLEEDGAVNKMKLQQSVFLQKKSNASEGTESIPEYMKPLIGQYLLSQPPAEFKVFVKDDVLQVDDPLSKKVIKLEKQQDNMHWIDEFGKNEIVFERNPAGVVTGMIIYINLYLVRNN